MFGKIIKWLSIGVTVSIFTVMIAATVYQVFTDRNTQIVLGILTGVISIVFLVINGIAELAKMGLQEPKNSGITYGPDMNKHIDQSGKGINHDMIIKNGKLEATSWKNDD